MRVELDDSMACAGERTAALVALDDALADLERQDEEKARILELKYFGGLSAEEMAGILGNHAESRKLADSHRSGVAATGTGIRHSKWRREKRLTI